MTLCFIARGAQAARVPTATHWGANGTHGTALRSLRVVALMGLILYKFTVVYIHYPTVRPALNNSKKGMCRTQSMSSKSSSSTSMAVSTETPAFAAAPAASKYRDLEDAWPRLDAATAAANLLA